MTEAQFHRQSAQQVPARTAESPGPAAPELETILADIAGALENVRAALAEAAENFSGLRRGEHPSRGATTPRG